MNKFIIFFIAAAFSAFIQQYDFIIIGAGWAGLGACSKLKAKGATSILILDAKNRTGGRCTSFTYGGVQQDLGATFIQKIEDANAINALFKLSKYTKVAAWFGNQTEWYINQTKISSSSLTAAYNYWKKFDSYVKKNAWVYTQVDQSLQLTLDQYWKKSSIYNSTSQSDIFIKTKVNQALQLNSQDNGAELNTMSTWQYDGFFDYSGDTDFTVKPSYSNFFQYLFNSKCSGVQTNLGQTVLNIDRSGSLINITTDKNSYLAKKVFVGASIGILQASLKGWTNASTISFAPALPQTYQNAINSIGFGRFQKLFVTFSSKFWDANSSTLRFVCKNPPCNFTEGWVVPNLNNTVVFFVAGNQATRLATTPLDTIKTQLRNNLAQFLTSVTNITSIHMTNWWQDKNILGGFSYAKVNTTTSNFNNLRKVLKTSYTSGGVTTNNYLWFIGEGTHPQYYSYSHGAYSSGVDAATAALAAV